MFGCHNMGHILVFAMLPVMAFGRKQGYCETSCDHELANEWARCSRKSASYIAIDLINCPCDFRFVFVLNISELSS